MYFNEAEKIKTEVTLKSAFERGGALEIKEVAVASSACGYMKLSASQGPFSKCF